MMLIIVSYFLSQLFQDSIFFPFLNFLGNIGLTLDHEKMLICCDKSSVNIWETEEIKFKENNFKIKCLLILSREPT